MQREKPKWRKPRGESTEAGNWGGPTRKSVEGPVMGLEQRGWIKWSYYEFNWQQEETCECDKAFHHSERTGDEGL
jgi:hypothetical protein